MNGVIVRMVKDFGPTEQGVLRVFPGGEIEAHEGQNQAHLARIMPDVDRLKQKRLRVGSQLLSIRQLSLMGWNVAAPTLWEEAEG